MALDYQSDIGPLKQQFFPMLSGGQNFTANMNYHQSVVMPMQEQTMKLQNNLLRMQQQDMAFERQKLALDSARRRAQMENETLAKLPEINKRLSEMFDDPATTSDDIAKGVGELTMQFAPAAAYSPAVNSVLQSAQDRVRMQERREYKQNILEEKDERRRFGIMSQAAQLGNTELVNRVAQQDGVVTEDEELFMGLADTFAERGQQKQQAELQEEMFGRQEAVRKERAGELDKTMTVLRGLRTKDGDEFSFDSIGEGVEKAMKNKGIELERQSRIALEAEVVKLRPDVDPFRLKEFSDEELLRATMMDAARMRAARQPQSPNQPTNRIINAFGS